jgi:glyoxalase family protein
MRRRILVRAVQSMGLLTAYMILTTSTAHADNCGSLSDCFQTGGSAASVTTGVAVIITIAVLALPSLLDRMPTPQPPPPEQHSEPPAAPVPIGPPADQQPQVLHADQQAQITRPDEQIQMVRPQEPVSVPDDPQVKSLSGIHHVTAIAGNPQSNIDFYTGSLGLRLVKLTVSSDNPGTYHLYYGDELGRPGSVLSFFAWPGASRGRGGSGQAVAVAFSVPEGALNYWANSLGRQGITQPSTPFGEQVFSFSDPDGLRIDLIAHRDTGTYPARSAGPIPAQYAIRGIHGVTLLEANYEQTHTFLTKVLGFRQVRAAGNRIRYEAGNGGPGTFLDVLYSPGTPPGQATLGTIHHLAWRTVEDEQRHVLQQRLTNLGINLTQGLDPLYFPSYSFREPGGVLFELAEIQPGFTVDEPPEQLGTHLMLPPWLAHRHAELQQILPPLRLPFAP